MLEINVCQDNSAALNETIWYHYERTIWYRFERDDMMPLWA